MINKIMNLTENDPMYSKLVSEIDAATDDNLIIVARGAGNRKHDAVKPIAIKNGIYFYLAYDLNGKTAYLGKTTPEQIYKAKANMIKRARIGSMLSVMLSGGKTLNEFEATGDPMNVVTLDEKMFGGGLLLCEEFLKEMEKKIGKYYIVPSSIHELIFTPANLMLKSDLTKMVKVINSDCVSENEVLADRAFEMNEWV